MSPDSLPQSIVGHIQCLLWELDADMPHNGKEINTWTTGVKRGRCLLWEIRTKVPTCQSSFLWASSFLPKCIQRLNPRVSCVKSRCQQEQQQQKYVNGALHTGSPSIPFNYLYLSSWFSWLQDVIKCSLINQAPSLPVLMRLYLQHPAF